jgi:hypothetical protein
MRVSRWVGVLGALVYAVGFVLVSSAPGGGDPDPSDFQDFYVEDENTILPVIGLFVLALGALALLWFFHELRTALASPDAGFGWASAALGLALVVGGAGLIAAPSAALEFSDFEFVGRPIALTFAQAGFGVMLVPGALFLGLGVGALSLSGRRTGVLVSWVAIAGIVAALLQLVALIWIPSFAIPLWVLLAGIGGPLARGTTAATAPA